MPNSSIVVTSPAGSGKTYRILEELKTHLSTLKGPKVFHPKKIVVVPYAEQAKRLKDLLLKKLPQKHLFGRSILSYGDFLRWLFPEVGGHGISEIQRKMLLEDILKTIPLKYYESSRELSGFVTAISSFISEWKGLFLEKADFKKALSAFPKDPTQLLKIQDLSAIFSAYQGRLDALGLKDFDDAFQATLQNPKNNLKALKKIESISFDGFYDFSFTQLKLLELIRKEVPEFKIYLTHEEGKRKDLFDLTSGTLAKLKTLGLSQETLKVQNKRTQKKDLLHIERGVFAGETSALPPHNIEIFEAVGLRGEVLWMARKILKLKRQTKMKWSDIAILFRQIGEYESYLHDVLAEYQIPYAIHERRKLRENTWARHVLEGIRILENNFEDPDQVFHFLRSSYLKLSREVVADFEQFAASKGFWKEPTDIAMLLAEWRTSLSTETLQEKCDRLMQFIRSLFEQSIEWHKEFSLEAFRSFLDGALDKWGNLSVPEIPPENLQAHKELENIGVEIQINQERSATELDFAGFTRAFEKGFQLSLFSIKPPAIDAVQIYNVQIARQKEYKLVFLGGLLQKNFPGVLREDTILKDAEREKLETLGFEKRLPRSSHERYYFYLALTRATDKLFLTYPRFDLEGKESLPSFFVQEVTRLFKKPIPIHREDKSLSIPTPRDAVSMRDLENHLAYELGEKGLRSLTQKKRPEAVSLYNFLRGKKELKGFQAPFPLEGKDIRISKQTLKQILKEKNQFSPTALESYGGCSIRYFFEKVLRLREPERYNSPTVEGTLFHDILKELIQEEVGPDQLQETIDEKLKTLERFHPMPYERKLVSDSFYQYLKTLITSESEYLKGSTFKPALFEESASFGLGENSPKPALAVKGQDEDFELIGEMDRVDVDESKKKAIVLDYKTGKSRRLDKKEIEEGTHLQLPLYGVALKELFSLEPVGFVIYSIKGAKRFPLLQEKIGKEEFQRIEDLALQYASRYVKDIRSGRFVARPKKCPDTCPFLGTCRFEKWRKIYLEMEDYGE